MKKRNTAFIIILFFIFHLGFLSNSLFTQEYGEEDYKWFYFDRILPLDSLPVNAYKDAVDFQWNNRLIIPPLLVLSPTTKFTLRR